MRYYTKNIIAYLDQYHGWMVFFVWVLLALTPRFASAGLPPSAISQTSTAPVTWGKDFDLAIGRSQVSMKPILVYYSMPNCSPCDYVRTFILKKNALQQLFRKFECVEVDITRRSELSMLAQVYSVPSFQVLESYGVVKGQFNGDVTAKQLIKGLELILAGDTVVKDSELLLETIRAGKVTSAEWRKAMLLMQDKELSLQIKSIVGEMELAALDEIVSCLSDELLAVRLGALDLLEERIGIIDDLDPWEVQSSEYQKELISKWKKLVNAGNIEEPNYSELTHERFTEYLQDLIEDDQNVESRKKSQNAIRILVGGKKEVIAGWITDYLDTKPAISQKALRRIKEVQYALAIPKEADEDFLSIAHKLVWGNQDVKVQTVRQLANYSMAVSPIIIDLLKNSVPIVREAAVETLFELNNQLAVDPIAKHLDHESDPDIIFTILRKLGDTKIMESHRILETFFTHKNEDLVIAAIEGVVKLSLVPLDSKMLSLLEDKRWRVKVAALNALKEKGGGKPSFFSGIRGEKSISNDVADGIIKCLDDEDEYVRHTAAVVIGELQISQAEKFLKKAYEKYPGMRGITVSTLLSLGDKIPESYHDALFDSEAMDLLFVLDQLKSVKSNSRLLVHRAAKSSNPDIACTALRIIANTDKRSKTDNGLLINALLSGLVEKQLTVIQDLDIDYDERDNLRNKIKNNSDVPTLKSPVKKASNMDVLLTVAQLMGDSQISDLVRTEAMVLLFQYGHSGSLERVKSLWPDLQPSMKASIVSSLTYHGDGAVTLLKKSLADDNMKVWKRALSAVGYSKNDAFVKALAQYLFDPSSRLKVSKIWPEGIDNLYRTKTKQLLPYAQQTISSVEEYPAETVIFALAIYVSAGTPVGQEKVVLDLTKHENPFIRRAAWITLLYPKRNQLNSYFEALNLDDSKYVRELIPALLYKESYDIKLALCFSEDIHYLGYNGLTIYPREYNDYYSEKKLNDEVEGVLRSMIENDRDPVVRFGCMLTLLSYRVPLELDQVVETAKEISDPYWVAKNTENFLLDQSAHLGKNFSVLLPLLKLPDDEDNGKYVTEILSNNWREKKSDSHKDIQGKERKNTPSEQAALNSFANPYEAEKTIYDINGEKVRLVFFSIFGGYKSKNPGKIVQYFKNSQPLLEVKKYDIFTNRGFLYNEVLSNLFNVDNVFRSIVPAVFMPGGYLVGKEFSYYNLEQLVDRSFIGAGNIDIGNITEEQFELARNSIKERADSYSWKNIVKSGFGDGKNLCLLTTLLFFISYLFKSKQYGKAVIRLGSIFISVLFVVTILLWTGLGSILSKYTYLEQIGSLIYWLMITFMVWFTFRYFFGALAALLKSKKDKKGKGETNFTDKRVFVVTILWAFVVSALNLVDIGNEYSGTFIFLIKDQLMMTQAVTMLLLYLSGLIIPSAILFIGCALLSENEKVWAFIESQKFLSRFILSIIWGGLFVVTINPLITTALNQI